jgi:hypothetical protein
MASYDDEAPRLSEIGRMVNGLHGKIDDFRNEVRTQLNDKVSKEVYNAEQRAMEAKITVANDRTLALELKLRSATNTIWGIVATVIAASIVAYLGLK